MKIRSAYFCFFCLLALLSITSLCAYGQDTLRNGRLIKDTSAHTVAPDDNAPRVKIVSATLTVDSSSIPHVFQPNPKRAGLYSAILPGLGQFYNRQYWKIPVIYAGLGVAGYFFIDNLNNYQSFRKAYIGRINNPYPTDPYVKTYTTDQLNQLQNDYNKYLDLTVLFSSVGYMLQVVEAITAAHLKNFDISRDISLRVQPIVFPRAVGMGLVVNF